MFRVHYLGLRALNKQDDFCLLHVKSISPEFFGGYLFCKWLVGKRGWDQNRTSELASDEHGTSSVRAFVHRHGIVLTMTAFAAVGRFMLLQHEICVGGQIHLNH